MNKSIKALSIIMTAVILSACGMTKPHSGYKFQSYNSSQNIESLEPAAGDIQNINLDLSNSVKAKQSCSFSSFHRKNAIGYEIDGSRHIGFVVSPSVDVFDPSDAKVRVGLNFTMAFGGSANKRPKCTYGSGYYGLLPYAMNDGVSFSGLTDINSIKSLAREKLEEREIRRQEREAKLRI